MRKTGLQLSLESKYLRQISQAAKKKGSPIGLPFS